MKNLLLTLVFFVSVSAIAGPIDYETAKNIASEYINKKTGTQKALKHKGFPFLQSRGTTSAASQPEYYIFDVEENEGYIVVSGDDLLKPILAHTDKGCFDASSTNPAVKWWLNAVKANVTLARTSPRTFAQTVGQASADSDGEQTEVAPLITTQWDQSYPFNIFCPQDIVCGEKSITGCVATAMSQIMNYYNYPAKSNGTISYTTEGHGFEINENLGNFTFDYSNMLDNYYNVTATPEQQDAVATLMYACGVAVNADYCTYRTGAYDENATIALKNNFGYKTATEIHQQNYSHKEWNKIIKNELNNRRPIYYAASNEYDRHAFICDGYDTDGLYHINWGWRGNDDGFFELTSMLYSFNATVICGLSPDLTQSPLENRIDYGVNISEGTTFPRSYIRAKYHIQGWYEGDLTWGLAKDGNLVTYNPNSYLNKLELGVITQGDLLLNIPQNIPNGEYKLVGVYKNPANGKMEIIPENSDDTENGRLGHLIVTLTDNNATLSTPQGYSPTILEVTQMVTPEIISNSSETNITLTLINKGSSDYFGELIIDFYTNVENPEYYYVSKNIQIPANETAEYTFSINVPQEGDILHTMISTYDRINDFITIHEEELPICDLVPDFEVNGIFYSIISKKEATVLVTHKGSTFFEYADEYSGEITIPDNVTYDGKTYRVTTIGQSAFNRCSAVTSVTICNNVTTIQDAAFFRCTNLESLTLGNSVKKIKANAFNSCTKLTSVTLPASLTFIGETAFQYCDLREVHIPAELTQLGDYAFTHNYNLQSITIDADNPVYGIPEGNSVLLDKRDNGLLFGWRGATIPDGVTRIGNGAFNGVSGISSITIPASVTSIGQWAFDACRDLTEIHVLATTPPTIYSNTFNGLYERVTLYATAEYANATYWNYFTKFVISGDINIGDFSYTILSEEEKTVKLIGYQGTDSRVEIPQTITSNGKTYDVTVIANRTFYRSNIESIVIPNTVTELERLAFQYCENLKEITLPESLTTIGHAALSHCGFVNLVIPNSVTTIAEYAFDYCGELEKVIIGSGVTSISMLAFDGCTNLQHIYAMGTTPATIVNNTFTNYSATLHVPSGTKAAYEAADYWNEFANIVEIQPGEDPTGIDNIIADEKNNAVYDLFGRRVTELIKGQVYIKGGKKIIYQ